ncbi:F0F1 ATP synthase subunit B [Actinomycetaceae bacterium TAE3-ERU4]|nr:F0F1 ATP synthase subunit B [Actinomycetaceae bacterium TAE3-ERU4]
MGFLVRTAADGAEHSLFLPHTYDLVWGTISFAIIAGCFIYYILPRFNSVLDERSAKIKKGLEDAKEAEQKLAFAQTDAQAIVDEAYRKAAEIRDEANEQARHIVAAAKQDALVEANRVTESARLQIEAEKLSAKEQLRSEVGALATDLAEKIVGEHLRDEELTARVVDRFLDDMSSELAS